MSFATPPNPLPPDHSVGGILLTITCILTVFTVITTVLRTWARRGRRSMGWDDFAIICCCLLAVIRTGIQIVSVAHGNGRHRWYLTQNQYQYVNFLTWLTQLFLFTNIALLKCSICILILRIKNENTLRYCLYGMMAGLILTNLLPIVVLLAECNPTKKYWNPTTPGRCWPTKIRIYSIYFQVAYSVVTDLVCALLPIAVLWKIKISMKTKLGVCGLMSLGLIATVVAVVRASSLGTKTADLSYDYCIAAIWANTELHLGIIATNLALSRMIWASLKGLPKSDFAHSMSRYTAGSWSRTGYVKSVTDRSRHDHNGIYMNTGESEEMNTIIHKETSVHITTTPTRETESSKGSWHNSARPNDHNHIQA